MYKIMIVCTGNTCRSPMAEALMKSELQKVGLTEKVIVDSSGLGAYPGDGASLGAKQAMENMGLNINDHRSKMYDQNENFDLVLTMTTEHKKRLLTFLPQLAGKVYTLKEYATNGSDQTDLNISDPYGGDYTVYTRTADEIKKYIDMAVKRLQQDV